MATEGLTKNVTILLLGAWALLMRKNSQLWVDLNTDIVYMNQKPPIVFTASITGGAGFGSGSD